MGSYTLHAFSTHGLLYGLRKSFVPCTANSPTQDAQSCLSLSLDKGIPRFGLAMEASIMDTFMTSKVSVTLTAAMLLELPHSFLFALLISQV